MCHISICACVRGSLICAWQEDAGFLVYESRAIARYIAAKAQSPLLPTDARAAALFEQAASVETSNFDPFASAIFIERFSKPRRGLTTDEARVAEVTNTLAGKIAAYEVILGKQRYLAGDELTLADLFHLPYGSYLALHGVDYLENAEKYPNVARWWKELRSRPTWQKVKDMNA
jgi:glutathione S-transferase